METLYESFRKSTGVSIDTRSIEDENIFFALSGPNFNGNTYAKQALEKGALLAIVDDVKFMADDTRYLLVDDTLTTLQQLANYHRNKIDTTIIGLTGSNGKTTTKELIFQVLSSKYKTQCTKGNFNNHIGVPLTLLACENDTEFLVLEMGANHQKEISFLCEIAEPDFGLITNIGKAHLEGFGGIEGVKKGKKEIYDYCIANNKSIFIDKTNDVLMNLLENRSDKTILYNLLDFTIVSDTKFVTLKYKDHQLNSQLTGNYNRGNIAIAVRIGEYFEVAFKHIASAISTYTPKNNRSEFTVFKGIKILKDAYNANPTSMRLSIENFLQTNDHTNCTIIIGDMLELGVYSESEHKEILRFLSSYSIEAYLVGQEFSKHKVEFSNFNFFKDTTTLKETLNLNNMIGKTVLIKGSRGIGLEKLFS